MGLAESADDFIVLGNIIHGLYLCIVMKIEEAIGQPSFESPQHRAGMNILFTANWLLSRYEAALKPLGLSLQQLNVLAILRGQPSGTATVNLVRERMIDRMPNVSRMLNKLMEKGLVAKERTASDQRVVYIKLTARGEKVAVKGREIFRSVEIGLSSKEAEALSGLLEKLRE